MATKTKDISKSAVLPKKTEFTKIAKIIWKIIEWAIMAVIIFVSAIIVVQRVTNNDSAFLGFRIFRVQTGSMIPKYNIGDVILVKEQDIDDIKVGDDVTYIGSSGVMKGKLVTHRVIEIETIDGKKAFHTQGIANNSEDPIVYGDQINGVVTGKMYLITTVCNLLNNKYIFYFCGVLPLTIYIFFRIIKANSKRLRDMKNAE